MRALRDILIGAITIAATFAIFGALVFGVFLAWEAIGFAHEFLLWFVLIAVPMFMVWLLRELGREMRHALKREETP